MKNILVPIGSSSNSTNTLQYAIDFAEVVNANVFVFRAFSLVARAGAIINEDEIEVREQMKHINEVVAQINRENVNVKIVSVLGNVVDSIESVDKEFGVDLIIAGPKPNDEQEANFLGRTSGSIIKQTDIPVFIIPKGYTFIPIKKILTAIKSGVISKENALQPLEEIIETFDAKMHLLQVKTQNFLPEDLEFYSELAAITSSYNSSENATLFQGVLEHLNKQNPDVLCVFRRKRGFFKKLWEQNIIKKVDFESRIPLLVLKGAE